LRKFLVSGIVLFSMFVINLLLAFIFQVKFIDLSVFIGVFFLAFTGSSAMGNSGKSELTFNDYQFQEKTGYNVDRHKPLIIPNAPFFTTLMYTLVSLIILLVQYWHVFG
jgi:hypothetical protein